ncbi:MAG TPA: cysteine desulfurase family protein [Stellaceae bacterium]|jgi:cysteine desulfurase|nr:cysteine desulfurase family protein [Stellaceae bacterium]
MRRAYLDWNATAPVRPEATAAVAAVLGATGNPSSVHRAGREARRALNEARDAVAALVNARADEIVFTSGGSEANALALAGFPGRRLLISAIEHDSVRGNAPEAEIVPVLADGRADLDALERSLAGDARPALVSIMFANNETGVVQDVALIARVAHGAGALFHCDAIQAAGKVAVDFAGLDVDLMSLSAHKLGGPMGSGALVVRNGLALRPALRGGGQERKLRAGTENLPGIAGFGAAAHAAKASLESYAVIAMLRDQAERRLCALAADAAVFGGDAPRLANTLSIAMPGVASSTQVIALDLAGVMVSAGSACSSGKVTRSHVLDAMGIAPALAESAIRISLGWSTSVEDIDQLVDAWGALYARTRARVA